MLVFFGAGKIGKKMLSIWRKCGLQADYFIDNNPELIGKEVEGIKVVSIESINILSKDLTIFITCKETKAIFSQLEEVGMCKKQIVTCNSIACILNHIFSLSGLLLPIEIPEHNLKQKVPNVLFDLSMGLTLGGVETWSVQAAQKLEKRGWTTALLVNNAISTVQEKKNSRTIPVSFEWDKNEWKIWEKLVKVMVGMNCTNIVCNFMSHNFFAACLSKRLFPVHVNVIVVIHSDAEIYYHNCILMKQYIDSCLVISSKIKKELVRRGFPERKIKYLSWEILCDQSFHHVYSVEDEEIRVGYAGRIVTEAKRIDYIVPLAKILKERGIRFVLEIAGSGIYEDELEEEIDRNELQEYVFLLRMIEHSRIGDFWKRQDIMISCSEYEGHSITQCEAMAGGAVPIVTDVSGARDDITDGENGFITPIGDIDQMAEKICFLYRHRNVLAEMGERAYTTIKEKYSEEKVEQLWKTVLQN